MSKNVLEVLKILNITDNPIEDYLVFCENTIINKILDRCNIENIPERLNLLIQEFLMEQYVLNKDGIKKGVKQVSSASDNGQTVTFETVAGASSLAQNAEEFLDKNMSTLNAYRKLRW